MRIAVIDPVVSGGWEPQPLPQIEGVEFVSAFVRIGPASIESRLDDELAAVGILEQAILAAGQGADAIVVNCMDDPGVEPAREMVTIPVVGPAEASTHLAGQLGDTFAILTTSEEDIPVVWELLHQLGAAGRCAGIVALGLPVLELEADPEGTYDRCLEAATAAIEGGAAVLIAGCTLLSGHTDRLQRDLAARGTAVPVIDPLEAALHHAVTLTRLGIRHSPAAYPPPPDKQITWPEPLVDFMAREEAS
jgi:allantoin racemase